MTWYVLTTAPQREIEIAADLNEAGIRALAPVEYRLLRINRHVRSREKKIVKPFPFFPGYLFAQRWYDAISHKHVRGYLGSIGQPTKVPEHVILQMIALHQDEPPKNIGVTRGLKPGDIVTILEGPFAGTKAKVARLQGPTHLRIVSDFLGSLREIAIDAQKVEAA